VVVVVGQVQRVVALAVAVVLEQVRDYPLLAGQTTPLL
jgi:hypothetical protein